MRANTLARAALGVSSAGLTSVAAIGAAFGQTLAVNDTAKSTESVVVTDQKTSYDLIPQKILDTPQTINVVPAEVIKEQGVTSLQDALKNVPGRPLIVPTRRLWRADQVGRALPALGSIMALGVGAALKLSGQRGNDLIRRVVLGCNVKTAFSWRRFCQSLASLSSGTLSHRVVSPARCRPAFCRARTDKRGLHP